MIIKSLQAITFRVHQNAPRILVGSCAALILVNCMDTPTGAPEKSESVKIGEDGQLIIDDKFVREEDINIVKGKPIPKGTFILKKDETEEYYIKTSSGPWEFNGLLKTSSANYDKHENTDGIEALWLTAGSSSGIICPLNRGYPWDAKIQVDLNRGAGGKYIYLCSSGPTAGGAKINQIIIDYSGTGSTFNANKPTTVNEGILGWNVSNSDMNQGAGGDYVWGKVIRQNFSSGDYWDLCKAVGVGVTYKDHWWETSPVPNGWLVADETDLNKNAGGAYIHMILKRSCP